jgi:hypothetical protein
MLIVCRQSSRASRSCRFASGSWPRWGRGATRGVPAARLNGTRGWRARAPAMGTGKQMDRTIASQYEELSTGEVCIGARRAAAPSSHTSDARTSRARADSARADSLILPHAASDHLCARSPIKMLLTTQYRELHALRRVKSSARPARVAIAQDDASAVISMRPATHTAKSLACSRGHIQTVGGHRRRHIQPAQRFAVPWPPRLLHFQ